LVAILGANCAVGNGSKERRIGEGGEGEGGLVAVLLLVQEAFDPFSYGSRVKIKRLGQFDQFLSSEATILVVIE